jgi:hypothetical protein
MDPEPLSVLKYVISLTLAVLQDEMSLLSFCENCLEQLHGTSFEKKKIGLPSHDCLTASYNT